MTTIKHDAFSQADHVAGEIGYARFETACPYGTKLYIDPQGMIAALAENITTLAEKLAKMEQLVKDAYFEGFSDGGAGADDPAALRESLWDASEVKKELSA